MPHLPVHAGNEFKGKSHAGLLGDCVEEIDAMVGTLVSTLESEDLPFEPINHPPSIP